VKGMFIQEKLFGDKDIAAITIKVETVDGVVSLSGTADNKQQADNAIKLAKSVKGVKDVKSTIEISTNS
jgi:hyperosmotically inducible protein